MCNFTLFQIHHSILRVRVVASIVLAWLHSWEHQGMLVISAPLSLYFSEPMGERQFCMQIVGYRMKVRVSLKGCENSLENRIGDPSA